MKHLKHFESKPYDKINMFGVNAKDLEDGKWIIDEEGDVGQIINHNYSEKEKEIEVVVKYNHVFDDPDEDGNYDLTFKYHITELGTKEEIDIIQLSKQYNI